MTTSTLRSPAISCHHCVNAIKKAVGQLDGVASVEGDPQTKVITVAYDPAKVTLDNIRSAMSEEGYDPE